ncbi:hypothetical protein [uncultured Bifidobacterium sp.]|uniref:hypothetical protein n=1 Tax=uncultured Bifidobacterium sp. TaxID=165187 RepID=UPI0028DC042E|nr:hypothetical protein [uncultured Bifidobacterium sp.]
MGTIIAILPYASLAAGLFLLFVALVRGLHGNLMLLVLGVVLCVLALVPEVWSALGALYGVTPSQPTSSSSTSQALPSSTSERMERTTPRIGVLQTSSSDVDRT